MDRKEYRHTDQNDEGKNSTKKVKQNSFLIRLSRFMLSVKPQPFHFSLFQMLIYLSAVLFLPFFL